METVTISSALRKRIGTVQNVVEQRLEPKEEQSIVKVLGVDAKAYVNNIEVLNGEANYTLTVVFNANYLNQNGEICTISEKTSTNGKFEDNTLTSQMDPLYKVEVVDVAILNANSTDIKVEATVELTLDCVDNTVLEPYCPTDENVLTKPDTNTVLTKCDAGKSTINIVDEFDLKQNINSVLFKGASVCVKEISSGTGYFTVEGELCLKLYLCLENGEEKTYKAFCETIPFKEEVDAESVTKDCVIEVCPFVKYDDMALTINEEKRNILNVDAPVCVRYVALKTETREMPCDAYSLTHKTNLVTDTFFTSKISKSTAKHHLDGSIEIAETLPRINKVLMVTGGNLNITNSISKDGETVVEGILTTNVVYLADDDDETTNSVQVELPFVANLNSMQVSDEDELFVIGDVGEISAKAKKGKEINLDADLTFMVESYSKIPQTFVKEVILTEELAQNPYPLAIYLAPAGSTLWDISKHLCIKQEVITEQNPNLTFPLETNQSVVYFSHK